MKVFLAFFLLFLTSCSVFHKSSKSAYSRVDSVVTNTVDTSSSVHKDSSYTKHEQSEVVNEVVIEGDSLSLVTYLPNYHEGDSVEVTNPVYRTWIHASDYFPQVSGKIKKITVRSSQTASTIEGGQLSTDVIQEGHKETTVAKSVVNSTSEESKSRCSFPFFWLIIAAAVVYLILDRSRIISATKFFFKL